MKRKGGSEDVKGAAAIAFALSVVKNRGMVPDAEVAAARAADYSDAEFVEIVAHLALNMLTNYVNEVFDTAVDFPAAAIIA